MKIKIFIAVLFLSSTITSFAISPLPSIAEITNKSSGAASAKLKTVKKYFEQISFRTPQSFAIKELLEEITLDYLWVLGNDGCFHLGRLVLRDNCEIWWVPLQQAFNNGDFCCQVVRCMTFDDFASLC